jgi:hypothetical protein
MQGFAYPVRVVYPREVLVGDREALTNEKHPEERHHAWRKGGVLRLCVLSRGGLRRLVEISRGTQRRLQKLISVAAGALFAGGWLREDGGGVGGTAAAE